MFHVKHEAWARQAASATGRKLATEQLDRLAAYEDRLRAVAVPRGMIASSDVDRLWERHILDGLRAVSEIPEDATVADLGSGAGIPGVPLAVSRPDARFTLIEPRTARAAFLEAVVDDLSLMNVEVVPKKAADTAGPFQVCTARAFASPTTTWQAAQRLLAQAGKLVYWAGESFDPDVLVDAGVQFRLSTHSDLARTGPLVIMGPQ
jgi:16S rRNA (guanine527-N7)-methyltransferase